jgi:hypothetical protein
MVAETARREQQDLQLPSAETALLSLLRRLEHLTGHAHHQVLPLGIQDSDAHGGDELLHRGALDQVGAHPQPQKLPDVSRVLEHGADHHLRRRDATHLV